MKIIYLVRHARTLSNTTGWYMGRAPEDLDEHGFEQARRLKARLSSEPLGAVYTSPLPRALSTAAALAATHRLQPQPRDDLIEIRLGDWQGLHLSEISRRWPDLWRQWRTDPSDVTLPNGESLAEVTLRARRAFEKVAGEGDKPAAIVTHDVVIRVIVAYVLGVANSIYRRLVIDNAALSKVIVDKGNCRLALLNDTSYLAERGL